MKSLIKIAGKYQSIMMIVISFIIVQLGINLYSIDNNSVIVVVSTVVFAFIAKHLKDNIELVNNKVNIITSTIYSLCISTVLMLQSKIVFSGNVYGGTPAENYFKDFVFQDFFKVIITFVIIDTIVLNLFVLFKKYDYKFKVDSDSLIKVGNIKFFILCFALVAIPFMFYLLTFAPGAVLGDSLNQINQAFGKRELYNQHPILHTKLIGFFMKIGEKFENYNLGVMLYSIFQLVVLSLGISYFLLWLKKKHIKPQIILLTYFYFIANTVFAAYAIIMWKDPIFCLAIFLLSLVIFDIIKSDGTSLKRPSTIIVYLFLLFVISFFRNNGLLVCIISTIPLFIKYNKKIIPFIGLATTELIVFFIITNNVYNALNIKTPFKESIGIPVQQLAGTIYYSGDIDKEDHKYLNSIANDNNWKDLYRPMCVDTLKNSKYFNKKAIEDDKAKFFGTWFSVMKNNLPRYIKSYLVATYGFWSIETKNAYGFVDTYINKNNYKIERTDYIKNLTGISLEDIWYTKVDFLGSGTLFWIMMFSIVMLINFKNSKYIVSYIPSLACYLTIMIATPVAFSLRYVFMFAYLLPFFVICPFMLGKNKN